jgi:hypothetical protein
MTTWHLDHELADRYRHGRVTPVLAASVEQHLLACAPCRSLVPADEPRLDAVWAEIVDRVEAPRVGLVERAMRALGVSDPTARLVAATPALRGAWLTGVLVLLVLAWVAGHASPRGTVVFVTLAPLLPVLGVALSFGHQADPTLQIAAASPYSLLRLLAARTAFVVTTTLVPATGLALTLPGDDWLSVGWLLPALAMSAVVLAAAGRVEPRTSAAVLATLWVGLASWRYALGDGLLVEHGPLVQLVSVAALLVATWHLIRHQHDLALRRTA